MEFEKPNKKRQETRETQWGQGAQMGNETCDKTLIRKTNYFTSKTSGRGLSFCTLHRCEHDLCFSIKCVTCYVFII